jgi:amino acid transporter
MTENAHAPHLLRRLGLLQATALNMTNMIGIGPFITIPLLMSALGGPQAMLGWIAALLIVIPDGMIWSELGAAMPGSGGSYVYLREAFGRETVGRLMAFLFIWQFILSGPLEIASGYIGFAQYFGYLRRADLDADGFNFWLTKLNDFGGDYIQSEMVKAFISSSEYRQRFGPM